LLASLIALSLRPKPMQVETARVTRGPLQVSIDEDGETRAHDRYTLASPVAGQLSRIELHEGDSVGPSTVIATITPLPLDPREKAEARARIQSAEALSREAEQQVARRVTDHEQTQRDLNRAKELAKDRIIARQALEQAQSAESAAAKDLEAARFRAQSAAAEVKRAQASLISLEAKGKETGKTIFVRPPAPGRILRVLEKSDRVVTAGTPLLVLSNPNRLEIVVDVLSTDAVKIRPGAPVLIENWGGPATLHARVRLVEPYGFTKVSALGIEEQRVNVIADFTEPPDRLGDGYRVDARIVTWENPDVLKVPVSALFRVGDSWAVFAVDRGRAARRLVGIVHRNSFEAEVTKGLDSGAEVVLHPPNELTDGGRVAAREPAPQNTTGP
ncbi:MAG TPA: efflux RND transporter periplasmic adaptor subunit, partial [Bryobacteraceae bacterium]|nr:efflux RND transporter periplasmic adaptor subunit [Bryobacteraceae bacterium]